MKGIAYGVGVGPGDPELMTQKAIRLIRENDVIAVPGKAAKESIAYRIAVQAVPEVSGKELAAVSTPMPCLTAAWKANGFAAAWKRFRMTRVIYPGRFKETAVKRIEL